MSSKAKTNKGNNEVMARSQALGGFESASFHTDDLLSKYEVKKTTADGQEVISYRMEVPIISGDNKGQLMAITDRSAIEAIQGIKLTQALYKWLYYRQGAYLVQLADSTFMKANEINSINKLAQLIDLGVEMSTSNALESVARRLEVSFDDKGNLSIADGLPLLSFWTYSNIISLVPNEPMANGHYDRTHLIDFIEKCNVTPLMSQKRVKELFKEYKAGNIEESLELPQNIIDEEKKRTDAKDKQDKEKKKAEEIAKSAMAYANDRLGKAKTFTEKKVIVLDLIDSLADSIYELSSSKEVEEYDHLLNNMAKWVQDLKESNSEEESKANEESKADGESKAK